MNELRVIRHGGMYKVVLVEESTGITISVAGFVDQIDAVRLQKVLCEVVQLSQPREVFMYEG